jgi:hypothetical protein
MANNYKKPILMGTAIDVTFLLSDALKTTTAAFTPVCMNPSNASDLTVHGVEEESTDNLFPIGVLQEGVSANSVEGRVRLLGVSKVYAGAAIVAGVPVTAANSSLGTTDVGGTVLTFDYANAAGATNPAYFLGRALEAAAATGDSLNIFVNPQLTYVTA